MATPTRHTIAHLAHDAEARFGARTWCVVPDGAAWRELSMRDIARMRDEVAAGLAVRGVERGDRVAIIAPTRFEWVLADLAILSRGAVTVGVYPTSTPDQIAHALRTSRVKLAFVAGDAEARLVASLRTSLEDLKDVVRFDLDGDDLSLAALRDEGRRLLAADAGAPARWRDAVLEDDDAALVFTSGTTGAQKAVALTHRALFQVTRAGIDVLGAGADDVGVAFLPLAHVFARGNVYGGLHSASTMWFARSMEEVAAAWQAARPTIVPLVPRALEKIQARVLAAVAQSNPRRRRLFARALACGSKRSLMLREGRRVGRRLALEYALWDRLVFRRVRAGLGWDRARFVLCGGAPLRLHVWEFFHAVGVLVLQGYGLTETSAATFVSRPDAWRAGSVGRALPGMQVKLADDGEVLVRTPGLFVRYDGDAAATRDAFDDEGYFRTGDVGRLDKDGFLFLTDRKKDLLVLAAGKNVAPQAIEAALCTDPRILQAVALGDGQPYVTALLVVDPAHRGTAAATDAVEAANAKLARYEQVKRFVVLEDELTVENGLLTPTLKVKRRAVAVRYAREIASLYDAPRDERSSAA